MTENNPYNSLWFLKQDGVVHGPFPLKQIQHDVLLGRLHATAEFSQDKKSWRPLSQLPQLIPEEFRHTASAEERERLLLARMHEDERDGHDRRSGDEEETNEQRHLERRRHESQPVQAHRQIKTEILEKGTHTEPPKGRLFVLLATLALISTFISAYFFLPGNLSGGSDCNAPVAPKVNWSDCDFSNRSLVNANLEGARIINARLVSADLRRANLRGASLAFSNLSGARLNYAEMQDSILRGVKFTGADLGGINARDADLSHANLVEANLKGANLSGVKLTGAIWIDGTVCAIGSVQTCQRMP